MINELRTYTFHPGLYPKYLALAEETGYRIRSEGRARLVGFWHVRSSVEDKVHHLWQYESFAARQADREELLRKPEWVQGFLSHALPCMAVQEVAFMTPIAIGHVDEGAHVYELRVTRAEPGEALALLDAIKAEAPSRATRALLMVGISPEPNSIYEVIAHDANATASDVANAAPGTDSRLVRCELMDPVSFSPLQ
jgi:hypothetical protein